MSVEYAPITFHLSLLPGLVLTLDSAQIFYSDCYNSSCNQKHAIVKV